MRCWASRMSLVAKSSMSSELEVRAAGVPRWSDRLAFDLALLLEGSGASIPEILEDSGETRKGLKRLRQDATFMRQVQEYRDEIRKNGLTFRVKCAAMIEDLLPRIWGIIHDPATSAAVQSGLIQSLAKWAGHESKKELEMSGGANPTITINLNAPSSSGRVIEVKAE